MKIRAAVAVALFLAIANAEASTWYGHNVLIQVDHSGTAPDNTYIDIWSQCETVGEPGGGGGVYLPLSRLSAVCTDYTPPTLFTITPAFPPDVGHTKLDLSSVAANPTGNQRFVDNDCRIASESTNAQNQVVIVVLVCTETIFTNGMDA
jgi:hypothetical protein